MIRRQRPWTWVSILAITATALVAGGAPAPQAQEAKKFKVYLSMFATGGGWLTAASNAIKALAATPPYDKIVDLKEVISGPEPQKQIAAYETMIASGADAIITIPANVTALNRTIKRGCDKGVIFFTFGYTVTEPCAYQVHAITNGFGENGGQVMANLLNGKGKILANHAFPGGPADKRHYDGFLSVIKKYPGMQVVAETWGRASDEVSQAEAAKVLAAHPDIDGVFTQPGELGIIRAFIDLSQQGSTSLRTVGPGIGLALVATAVGLFAAIPAAIAYNYFSHSIREIAARMDDFALEFLNLAERNFGERR